MVDNNSTPAAIDDVVGPLQALLEKATLPWAYRPDACDDWGFIRGPEVPTSYGTGRPVVAISRGSDTDYDEHRRNGTDPYKAHGDLIVAAVNALPSLIALITSLAKERDEAATYTRSLLVSFVNEHCDPVPDWAPLPDLIGMLTQLDNATTVCREATARADAAERDCGRYAAALIEIANMGYAGAPDIQMRRIAAAALSPVGGV